MRVAFDLDNTLIRCGNDFPLETPQRRSWAKLLGNEQLREGIQELVKHCRQHGWEYGFTPLPTAAPGASAGSSDSTAFGWMG